MRNFERPLFHSKVSLFIFTTLLSSFFGSLLYAQNLKEIGKRKDRVPTIIAALLWNFLCAKLLTELSITNTTIRLLLPNIIAGFIFITALWNYHFKEIATYKKRKIWIPLIIAVLVYGILILLNILVVNK